MAAAAAAMEPGFRAEYDVKGGDNMEPAFADTADAAVAEAAASPEPALMVDDITPPVNPVCDWDNMQPCDECRKVRCTTCTVDQTCDTCELGAPRTCFAFCELDPTLCQARKTIDFQLWPEMYAAVRCLRDRRDPTLSQKSDHKRQEHIQKYFPGFCKHHNEGQYQTFVANYWHRLNWRDQLLLNYMIDGSTCALANFDNFLAQHRDLYQNMSLFDIMQLLLTPCALMAVDTLYLQTFLNLIVDRQQFIAVSQDAELMQKVQNLTLTPAEAEQYIVGLAMKFQEQRHNYQFLVDGILQSSTLHWLLDANVCLRTLNWNLLFFKVARAILLQFLPGDVRNAVPAFHPSWKKVWNTAAESVMAQLPPDDGVVNVRQVFGFHWSDFMANMTDVVLLVDKIVSQVPQPDPRPEIDPSAEMQKATDCPAREN